MCGRSRCALAPEQVIARAGTATWEGRGLYQPLNNVSPGAYTPVVHLNEHQQPIIHTMRWGLVPSFTKQGERPDFWRMFNARSESVGEKPSFRRLVPSRRCIVLVNGFYEWKKEQAAGKKQPYYVYLQNSIEESEERPMALAGLYDIWDGGPNVGVIHTYTILTTDSCKQLQWLHDRMPVILKDRAAEALWLDTTNKGAFSKLHSILGPYEGRDLKWRAVTKEMSNPQFQGEAAYKEIQKPSISKFFQPRGASLSPGAVKQLHKDETKITANSDEGAKAETGRKEETPKKKVEHAEEVKSPVSVAGAGGSGGLKRKEPPEPSPSRPGSAAKAKKSRPANQPDIAAFFTNA